MAKAKKKEEIEEVVVEVIPSGDEGGKIAKKKPGRPKKVDGLILAENPHYFISQPTMLLRQSAIFLQSREIVGCRFFVVYRRTRIFQMDIQRSISLP